MKQFVSGEDDLFDTLNQSLARDGIGQTDLDDQLEFGTGQQLDGHFDENDGQRRTKEYVFGESSQPLVDLAHPPQHYRTASLLSVPPPHGQKQFACSVQVALSRTQRSFLRHSSNARRWRTTSNYRLRMLRLGRCSDERTR
jgi:hypothetical protein